MTKGKYKAMKELKQKAKATPEKIDRTPCQHKIYYSTSRECDLMMPLRKKGGRR